MKIDTSNFGENATLYTLENDNGVQLSVSDFGARIIRLKVPIDGEHRDIVLGFDNREEYLEKDSYIGATIGRVAGRIASGQFNIDNTQYQVEVNENGNTLHGGTDSFETKMWQARVSVEDELVAVTFTYDSPENEHGFPGNLHVEVKYSLNNDNEWHLDYKANTDAATLFNPTNHVYFNLDGDPAISVSDHKLQVNADYYAPLDTERLTTGERQSVGNSVFDFRTPKRVSETFTSNEPQNVMVDGLDHPFFLNKENDQEIDATLISSDNKISVNMMTSLPAVVIFTAGFGTDYQIPMKNSVLKNHGGITLETQVTPGAEKYSDFGNIVLRDNETYDEHTVYRIVF